MLFAWLVIVFVLEYTRPHQFIPFIATIKLYSIAPIGLFVVSLFATTRNTNAEILKSTIGKLLLLFFFLVTVSAIFSINKHYAWDRWRQVLGYLFLFFMIAKICDSEVKLSWLFRVIIGMHLWLIFQNPSLLTEPNLRSYVDNVTFLGDGNDFSLSVAITLPMCLYLFQTATGKIGKVFYIGAAIILIGAVMGTQSRGAALAILSIVLFLWSLSPSKGKGIVIIAAGLIIVLALASETYLSRMETITDYESDSSAMGRILAWESGFKMANERPLTGMGPGCFPIAFGQRFAQPGIPWMTAHSMYFLALGELGYPGVLLVLWLLWRVYRNDIKILKSIPRDDSGDRLKVRKLFIAVTGSLIGFSVAGAFLSVLYYPHLYVISGITLTAIQIYSRQAASDERQALAEPVEASTDEDYLAH